MFRKWKTTICCKIHMLLEVGFASVFFSEDVFLEQTHWLFKTYVFYGTCVFEAVLYASVHSSRASIIPCNYANLQGIVQDCARLRNTAVRSLLLSRSCSVWGTHCLALTPSHHAVRHAAACCDALALSEDS